MSATVITPTPIAPQLPWGMSGSCTASSGDPSRSIRLTWNGKTTEMSVTATMATSGPGTRRILAGTQRQAIRMTITRTPKSTPGRCAAMICPGRPMRLCQAVLLDFPPSNTCACLQRDRDPDAGQHGVDDDG